jgi:citrate synthase
VRFEYDSDEEAAMETFTPGLEGVIAVETAIAEPDRDGGALRYRGVDVVDLVGRVPFEGVWGLLVDGEVTPGLAAEPADVELLCTGEPMADLQAATAALGGLLRLGKLMDLDAAQARHDLERVAVTMIDVAARIAAAGDPGSAAAPGSGTLVERFLRRWRGEADPLHARAIETYWICAAEHGLNASTFAARVVASTGADCAAALAAAVGALSGPLHGGAPARVLPMLDAAAAAGDIGAYVRQLLDSGERLRGFGHRVYRAEDPRARLLRETAERIGAPRYAVARALEDVALAELARRKPQRVLATNVEYWSAVVLDAADVPAGLAPALFACSRTAGWSAHVLEQHMTGRLIRPAARYVGPARRALADSGSPPRAEWLAMPGV